MEGLLRELHHLVTFCPRVQAAVDQWRRDEIGPMSQCCTQVIDTLAAINHTHTFAHHLLLWVGCAELIELLAPQIDLITQVHLGRTERLTGVTQGAGTHVARVLLWITKHTEVDTDGTWNKVAVTVTATATIDRTGVHARTATDALQGLPVLWVAYPLAAPVIYQYDVHLVGSGTCLAEMTCKRGGGLTCARTAEHALEHGQAVVVGDDLLQTDGGNVEFRTRG